MSYFEAATVLVVLTALFSYVNYRFIRLPMTMGVMGMSLAASLAVWGIGLAWEPMRHWVGSIVGAVNFERVLLHGLLAFLLFAGAMQVKLKDLAREWPVVALMATFGTAASMFIVGGLVWWVLPLIGMHVRFVVCLLFGTLISPTDPIAVLGMMRREKTPRSLEMQISGEALFNDGVGIVLFIVLLGIATGSSSARPIDIATLLLKEAFGGVAVGLVVGTVAYELLRRVDHYRLEVSMTVAVAMGTYALADALHVSAPIAAVVAGLLIGNPGRAFAMSERTRRYVDGFWELVDDMLNGVLFLLIGLEVLVMPFTLRHFEAALLCIPILLIARFISVSSVIWPLRLFRHFEKGAIRVLTWSGLRGGISVAMALSLPQENARRNLLVVITYVAVVFGIFVQGLSIGKLIRSLRLTQPAADGPEPQPDEAPEHA